MGLKRAEGELIEFNVRLIKTQSHIAIVKGGTGLNAVKFAEWVFRVRRNNEMLLRKVLWVRLDVGFA